MVVVAGLLVVVSVKTYMGCERRHILSAATLSVERRVTVLETRPLEFSIYNRPLKARLCFLPGH